ncbi:MAG: hypothetical protein WC497_05250 [Patescibacteria group bacterium]
MKKINTIIGVLILLIIAGAVGVWLWCQQSTLTKQSEPMSNNTPTNSSASQVNTNQPIPVSSVPRVMANNWQDFGVENNVFYVNQSGTHQSIETPFDLKDYHTDRSPYGYLFWRRGAVKKAMTTDAYGYEPYEFEYEDGINPEFHWYDFTTQEYVALPAVRLDNKDRFFERIYSIHFSSTEPKLAIEIGSYDTESPLFAPGLDEEQPYQTHGLVYDIPSNTFSSSPDPLTQYVAALHTTSTHMRGFFWDSAHQVAVGVPGGEGCGTYDTLEFVNLKDISVDIAGGNGSFDYQETDNMNNPCNPRNGVSPDNRWFVLSGETKGGKYKGLLFTAEQGVTPVKQVYSSPGNLQGWDLTGTYPVFGLNGSVYDFNMSAAQRSL